jgi:hypothetical protein
VEKMSPYRRSGFLAQLLRIVGGFEATRKRKKFKFWREKMFAGFEFRFQWKSLTTDEDNEKMFEDIFAIG